MPLSAPRFASNPRLQAASNNSPAMRQGENGEAVEIVQQALVDLGFKMPITTNNGRQPPDGIFGSETARTVRDFQFEHGLQADGVVGRNTLATLDSLFAEAPPQVDQICGNCFEAPHTKVLTLTQAAPSAPSVNSFSQSASPTTTKSFFGSNASSSLDDVKEVIEQIKKMKIPKELRPLTSAQEKTADAVFGSSLDYTKVLISNGLGFNGRAFVTVATIEVFGLTIGPKAFKGFTIMNLGTFTPKRELLLHELTHVWQSQHHSIKHQFMINAVASQKAAEEARASGLKTASAYVAKPSGKAWSEYGAEQNAARIEAGVSVAVAHARAAKRNVTDAENVTSLAVPRFGIG